MLLTLRQNEILEFIRNFVREHSYSPTHREIKGALGISSFSYLNRILDKRKVETIEDEVKHKIDIIIEKVRATLDMYTSNLRFRIVLFPDKTSITKSYRKLYNSKRTVVGFYDPNINTVYFSVKNSELKVVAHEFGHAVVANFFEVSPPVRIHELMAQFAEKHILD